MKKRLVMLLLVLAALGLCACGRQESPVEDFEYEMVDGEVVITGYTGTDREIYIPAMINDRPVTQIGEEAFEGYDMTLVDIPEGVVIIHDSAFYKCAGKVYNESSMW